MSKDEFRNFYKEAWKKPHGFVVIDLTSDISNGKYRKGLGWTNFTYRCNKILLFLENRGKDCT